MSVDSYIFRLILCRDNGFLNYWTISNIPLFILAAPMLYILLSSGAWAWRLPQAQETWGARDSKESSGRIISSGPKIESVIVDHLVARRFAAPQIVLAALALTSYHVQIITRLSSGYPVWYWWLASMMMKNQKILFLGKKCNLAVIITRWMVIYAMVQGGLFAGFLPPA